MWDAELGVKGFIHNKLVTFQFFQPTALTGFLDLNHLQQMLISHAMSRCYIVSSCLQLYEMTQWGFSSTLLKSGTYFSI